MTEKTKVEGQTNLQKTVEEACVDLLLKATRLNRLDDIDFLKVQVDLTQEEPVVTGLISTPEEEWRTVLNIRRMTQA